MIDEAAWHEYVALHPLLFHVTPEANLAGILADGLKPGSDLGLAVRSDFFAARPHHSYLIQPEHIPIVDVNAEPRVVAILLAQLDPARVDPDEDMVMERFPDAVAVPPPSRRCDPDGRELPGQVGMLASWADSTPGFDRSAVTERSLRDGGRMSYRGVIPREAISEVFIPSNAIAAFVGELDDGIGSSALAVPHRSTPSVEIERSRTLARATALEICALFGQGNVLISLDDHFAARAAPGTLRGVAIALFHGDRHEEGAVVVALSDALGIATRFSGYAPRSDLDTAAHLAAASAEAVNRLARVAGVGALLAAKVAEDAVQAALRVGDEASRTPTDQ
jgi:hypothetical protein